eukprot:CAMPEP_0197866680 /NCGR_PEP_ID=MMETSP1438-20131217/44347_1 /TAXON_ID=1461541 /ORGANISM="Pterosperma sp., Strain CCMP1384" /LENGTH=53 /DNA_ID=CAMNT_0043485265 /DNA_START=706 /DNA_END=864 /DNA_ORIENTATION=-
MEWDHDFCSITVLAEMGSVLVLHAVRYCSDKMMSHATCHMSHVTCHMTHDTLS